ncbi:MAG: cysteine desulfurase [candidate division KSB1 bacterium]|nr:cysteine desulfurase [candidate division KSB1 bacterium]MDZ7274031.1 cysteine desulfurase [candidate division KSB1 bacterium]MDZ7286404.1 cysteine desulfurase [candidate division KSB1 bacterium]MDZ7296632.1 cysteine desulfurase [candidate division KSB1 bacterium]MDZ7306854.1 cysteine desulfurase [candidate division KSB1 bacterium]
MNRIYLDYSATTPLAPEVLAEMQPYLTTHFGNASSIHSFGREARVAVDQAREKLAASLAAQPQEIIFTSGGTESNNTAILGIVHTCATPQHIITSRIEHPSVLMVFRELERRGWQITYLEPEADGRITTEMVRRALRPETVLLSIMHANNEIGTINPIEEIAELAAARRLVFHSDAVQTFGKLPLDLRSTPVTLLSISGHKIYGPKGVGALFVRQGVKLAPLLQGGKQERERRAGTENVAAIVGFAKAAELILSGRQQEQQRLQALAQAFWQRLQMIYPKAVRNSPEQNRLPGILNISFPGMDSLAMVMSLDLQGIAVSNGSACSSGSVEPSHVLRALKLSPERVNSAIRFSLGRMTTEAELDRTLEALQQILQRRRGERSHPRQEARQPAGSDSTVP